jgi:hypothetical protein
MRRGPQTALFSLSAAASAIASIIARFSTFGRSRDPSHRTRTAQGHRLWALPLHLGWLDCGAHVDWDRGAGIPGSE